MAVPSGYEAKRSFSASERELPGGWRFWRNRAVAGVVGSAVNAGPILCVLTPALMGADASAGVIALDEGTFTEGYELDRNTEKQVPKAMIGRRLSQEEAKRLLAKFNEPSASSNTHGAGDLRARPSCLRFCAAMNQLTTVNSYTMLASRITTATAT
jgi:hypothetical protein